MALAGSSSQGELRAAIESLLRACVEVDRQVQQVADESREHVRDVARVLVGVRMPPWAGLADEIAGLGGAVSAELSRNLADARAPFVAEVHQLLGLLAPLHGLGPVPALTASAAAADLTHAFPAGFARDYVADLLRSVERSVTLDVDAAGQVPIVSDAAADDVKVAVGAKLPNDFREECVRLLRDSICHTVERHGPQISDQAQLARLLWVKDPSGDESWQITSAGPVESTHWCGPVSGGFTSPAALARPIEAFLRAAHEQADGIDEFLKRNTKKKAKVIGIHVSAQLAGLQAGDASGYLGAGTGTKQTRQDWLLAREHGLAEGRPTVFGVPYDPIATGTDPGATLVFRRDGNRWQLITCYPVEKQGPTDRRLEDLT
ncbi:hypothetical protein [Jiangella gansuensis]|uniref:hypothetical protein n=1 Tax=Jiangella gansuensis TaxID=281473 RepID=UPI0004AEB5BD|nr:hypothetical protein [Jiangella gansuensis]